jgi:SAM-dependent methyltransferase
LNEQHSDETIRCPVCGHGTTTVVEQLTGSQLRRLWRESGFQLTPEAWGRIQEQSLVALKRCAACGFAFFDPSLAGNEVFYKELERSGYFAPNRPEFFRTVEFAKRNGLHRVLDIGCGSGAFLDLARQAGCETFGLELNSAAAAKARAKAHRIFSVSLEQLIDAGSTGGFDLITLFQVLEHLANPVAVLKKATSMLKNGGYVAIAVPSEEGVLRLSPWDPSQWPPHHVSRWRRADLKQLGRATGLKIVELGADILLGSAISSHWQTHNRFAAALGKPGRPGGDMLGKMISLLYRKTGMKFFFPHRGNSIYGYFQKTLSEAAPSEPA